MKDEQQKLKLGPNFRLPLKDPKRQVVSDYCAYFRFHEERKELEAKRPKLSRPSLRRIRGRRLL